MTFFYALLTILQATGIYLGVGSSTLAIASFFTAIRDGQIDPSERRMLGVIYFFLRIAMGLILLSTAALQLLYPVNGTLYGYLWILVAVLFVNAGLMTAKRMPSRFGPSIQAATWYTLGFLATITMFDLYPLSPSLFWGLYLGDLALFLATVNGVMWYFKRQRQEARPTT